MWWLIETSPAVDLWITSVPFPDPWILHSKRKMMTTQTASCQKCAPVSFEVDLIRSGHNYIYCALTFLVMKQDVELR